MEQGRTIVLHNALDLTERGFMALFFGAMAYRLLPHFAETGNIVDICVLISEGASTLFVLAHRRTEALSLDRTDWALTSLATVLPTLVFPSSATPLLSHFICNALVFHGFVLQIAAKLTLRRSFGLLPANRGVKVGGPYRLLRHPIYAGYVLTHIAVLGTYPTLWNLAIYLSAFAAQCLRILAEERILRRDPIYAHFMLATRYRLIPFLF